MTLIKRISDEIKNKVGCSILTISENHVVLEYKDYYETNISCIVYVSYCEEKYQNVGEHYSIVVAGDNRIKNSREQGVSSGIYSKEIIYTIGSDSHMVNKVVDSAINNGILKRQRDLEKYAKHRYENYKFYKDGFRFHKFDGSPNKLIFFNSRTGDTIKIIEKEIWKRFPKISYWDDDDPVLVIESTGYIKRKGSNDYIEYDIK